MDKSFSGFLEHVIGVDWGYYDNNYSGDSQREIEEEYHYFLDHPEEYARYYEEGFMSTGEMLDRCMSTFNYAMDNLPNSELILALTFTLLDTAASKLNTTTPDLLKEYGPVIESVNEECGPL